MATESPPISFITLEQAQELALSIFHEDGGSLPDQAWYRFQDLLTYMAGDSRKLAVNEVSLAVRNVAQALEMGDASILIQPRGMRVDKVVDVQEFVESKMYMGQKGAIRPKVLEKLWELFHGDGCDGFLEAVLAGAIGWGKSYFSEMGMGYLLYKLSCFYNPQLEYGLAPGSSIVFVMQSIKLELAKKVLFNQFGQRVKDSPYFTRYFPFDTKITTEMRFPNNVMLIPISSADTSALGLNVFGALMDEMNFMARIEKSSRSKFTGEEEYDQAEKLYSTILRRMRSRYNVQGRVPGKVFLVSSANYPGDFTDRKIKERDQQLEETGRTGIFLAKMSQWEAMPKDRLSSETFLVEVGDSSRRSRLLKSMEEAVDPAAVLEVPMDYYTDFRRDIEGAIRDLAGIPIGGSASFIKQREHIVAAVKAHEEAFQGKQLFVVNSVDLTGYADRLLDLIDEEYLQLIADPLAQFTAHVDLALTGDSCGLSIGHFGGYRDVGRSMNWDDTEKRYTQVEAGAFPITIIDGVLEVVPPLSDEIDLTFIGDLLEALASRINLTFVTADSFQSAGLLQRMRKLRNVSGRPVKSGILSVDIDISPYAEVKQGLRDSRLILPNVEKLQKELREIMLDPIKKKVDHPVSGSKDLSDAVAGVTYVTMRTNAKTRSSRGQKDAPALQEKGGRVSRGARRRMHG